MNRGFILIEATISYVLLAVALLAMLPVFILAIKTGKDTEQRQVATYLSQELLEEVRMRKWDQNTPTPHARILNPSSTLGPDGAEDALDKKSFNDIDDFNGWSETAVTDPLNNPVPEFAAYTRAVSVSYVDSNMVVVSTPTTSDYKQVTVCTQTAKRPPLCLATLFTNH